MGRGPLSQETKNQRALEKINQFLASVGKTPEEVGIVLQEPKESTEDKFREAESVLLYFRTGGYRFKEKQCAQCGGIFAYHWNIDSIQRCSVQCYIDALKQIGLEWDPSRDQSRRWGPYAPAVVPPKALSLLKEQLVSQEDQLPDRLFEED